MSYPRRKKRDCTPLESAACGSISGSIAAAITTPLDVAKTRIMLHEGCKRIGILPTLRTIATEGGIEKLYSGILPRTIWMGLGGFIFFGAYEVTLQFTYWICPQHEKLATGVIK
ncbi:unnamed protein product [Anisakis simplex]|uniref:S-adenosylmethionine mitochondrial carrier protein (inferred by orthology to a human protein) n=1 Tax=Anisakis simplex TaxID=6269 RepID=A0A0M3K342_ANISI|nr:unnamed protein product [Anisakis simplex]